jgi:holo-[acyl-carrier protein] synthase
MIIGIGVDIVDVNSFTESFNKSERFKQKVFTETEIAYCESKPNKYQHYAARFAAKEAVMKAIGTGWNKGIQWKQIETINEIIEIEQHQKSDMNVDVKGGKPEIILRGKALAITNKIGINKIFISLSHSEKQAIAFVVLENCK